MESTSDIQSIDSWIAEQKAPLSRFALSLGLPPQDAEDVVQESFIALTKLLQERPDSINNPRAYAFALVRNNANKRFRDRARRNEVEFPDDHPEQAEEHADRFDEPLLKKSFRQAYAKLSQQERDLVRKYYFEGWTYDRIGREMGCSPQNVWKLLKKIVSRVLAGELRKTLIQIDADYAKELFPR